MASDRTEKPTAKRLEQARKRGQIARSQNLVEAAQLLTVLIVLTWYGPAMATGMANAMREGLSRMSEGRADSLEAGQMASLAVLNLQTLVLLAGPLALATAVAIVAFTSVQGGLNIASEALTFNWSRLNPATGVKRLFGRVGLDLVKILILATALGWISWRVVNATLVESSAYARMAPQNAAAAGWSHLTLLLRHSVIALAAVGGADYLAQRWRLEKSLRMTKQEVRDDARMSEGNPEIKARVRRLQREVARRRMLSSVPKATVVITNPTHYAVALEYTRDAMPAPRVVAKGKDAMAARIREIAREHEVPIVENVPLAQSLYRGVEVGEFIPAELFGAVAETLAYLIKLKQLAV